MRYPLEITTEPGDEPVTLADAKEFFREDRSVEDALIFRFIYAARQMLEKHTGYHLIDTEFKMYLTDFKDVKIPRKPLKSGSATVEYIDTDGNTQTLATDKYAVHDEDDPAQIEFLSGLPNTSTADGVKYPVWVNFTLGYGTSSVDVPEDWQTAILLLAFLIWKRDGNENPLTNAAVQSYLQNYKVGRFK